MTLDVLPNETCICSNQAQAMSGAEPAPPVHLCGQISFRLRHCASSRQLLGKGNLGRLTSAKLPLHPQDQSNPAQDRREDSNYAKWPSAKQMESKARAARGDGQQQQPLAKPREGTRAVSFPFRDLASHPFKSALHIVLRNRHYGLSLAKATIYVHCIQCVVCACAADRRYGCLRRHPQMIA